jgi:hypothetical protein
MVLGGFWGVRQFLFMGVDLGPCVDGFRCFLGELGNFFFMGVDLGHCVDGFRWYLGS